MNTAYLKDDELDPHPYVLARSCDVCGDPVGYWPVDGGKFCGLACAEGRSAPDLLEEYERAVTWREISLIETQALELGWSWERLWNPDFWPPIGHQRGLISVLNAGDTLGEVTAETITIHHPNGFIGKFRR